MNDYKNVNPCEAKLEEELVDFFDLLARFDFEDNKVSGINKGIPDSAPGLPLFESENTK